ncbi:hypothetical protein C8R43DRAFT_1127153 [Mycena crocata]|nr:hypothetical protein C8R43DRAFT_1127153 [Mycena crocata]
MEAPRSGADVDYTIYCLPATGLKFTSGLCLGNTEAPRSGAEVDHTSYRLPATGLNLPLLFFSRPPTGTHHFHGFLLSTTLFQLPAHTAQPCHDPNKQSPGIKIRFLGFPRTRSRHRHCPVVNSKNFARGASLPQLDIRGRKTRFLATYAIFFSATGAFTNNTPQTRQNFLPQAHFSLQHQTIPYGLISSCNLTHRPGLSQKISAAGADQHIQHLLPQYSHSYPTPP